MLRLVPFLFPQERGQYRGESVANRSAPQRRRASFRGNDLIQVDVSVLAKTAARFGG